jgi:putative two-component system response regulator
MTSSDAGTPPDILIVDDTPANLQLLGRILTSHGCHVRTAGSGGLAISSALERTPDLILLDVTMPEMTGYEVCERLKAMERLTKVPVIFISALQGPDDKLRAFAVGGVDYVTKPFHAAEVCARVDTHVSLRRLQIQLEQQNSRLRELVDEQVREISESQLATIFALAKLAESRDDRTGHHTRRVQDYCRALARAVAATFGDEFQLDAVYVDAFFGAAPLHDVGKVGIPDAILVKPDRLTEHETAIMRKHTLLGATTLGDVLARYPNNLFVKMGVEMARSHHERWDGSGYPDGLRGEEIPLSARMLAVADQYDALRSSRPYKPAFDHDKAVEILTVGDERTRPEHFDPRVLEAFIRAAAELDEIFCAFRERLDPAADQLTT